MLYTAVASGWGTEVDTRHAVTTLRLRFLSLAVLAASGTLFLLPPVVAVLVLVGVVG